MSSEHPTTTLEAAQESQAAEAAQRAEELEQDLHRLRALLEESDVEGARRFVKELEQRWPESVEVQHFARVLAPPRTYVLRGKPIRPLDQEYAWLREHAREYPGQWVALQGDRLIAADADFAVVHQIVRSTPGAEGALLHLCPKRRESQ